MNKALRMKAKVYNTAGESVREVELDPAIFGIAPKPALVQRAVVAQMANARQAIAHTKTRGDVRGGGKKPWRQKGTGRARHGSIRSPLWVGGGITFGPRSTQNFAVRINKKEKRKALCMTLSDKAQADRLILLDQLSLAAPKTKLVTGVLKHFAQLKKKRALLVQPKADQTLWKASRNLPNVSMALANTLNVVDVLRHDYLILPLASLDVLRKTYALSKKAQP